MQDRAAHWRMNKTHQAAKCDWQVITARAKSCGCVNPECDWLFWQVHLFPTVSHRECSACRVDNKTLAMLHVPALKHRLPVNVFFLTWKHAVRLSSSVPPCEATAPFPASTSVRNDVCWPTCWWGTVVTELTSQKYFYIFNLILSYFYVKANLVMRRKVIDFPAPDLIMWSREQKPGTFETSPVFTVQYSRCVTWIWEFIVWSVSSPVCMCVHLFIFLFVCLPYQVFTVCFIHINFLVAVIAAHLRRECGRR